MKLWDKGYDVDKEIEKFTVGEDYLLDMKLVYWDAVASIAHAKGLHKADLISNEEMQALISTLQIIAEMAKEGTFEISQEDEDCHTAIENYLVAELADTGKKIHTGRSRNDQVVAALKLYMKNEINKIKNMAEALIKGLEDFSADHTVPIPGYTHMRKAMPSSVSLWADSFSHSLKDDIMVLEGALDFLDSSPLGSAAGYGTSLGLDRKFVAQQLGFSRVQQVLSVQNSRGKNELVVLNALSLIMLDLNKLANDIILWSMPEFGFFSLPEKCTTGSSIMPQKKNPDVLELVRAKAHVVQSLQMQISSIILNLPSGYNRDLQLTKKPLMEGFEITKDSLSVMCKVIDGLKVNTEACKQAMTDELYAAEAAYALVEKGIPFRDAYKQIAEKANTTNTH